MRLNCILGYTLAYFPDVFFQMYKKVACSLRENPSKVKPFQAGSDSRAKTEENRGAKKLKKKIK